MMKKTVASDNTDHIGEEQDDEKLNLGPNKKKLLVLPVGGFLVHRAHRRRPNTVPKSRRPDFCSGIFMIYKRPFCQEFLEFCFERFQVGIWSSAMEHNIDAVLTNVMGNELKSKLLFTRDQNQCTETNFKHLDNKYKPLYLKIVDHLWSKKYIYLSWSEGEYTASNTLLITDPVKALLNPPNTAIFLGDYDPNNNRDDFLGCGCSWTGLQKLKMFSRMSKLTRSGIQQ